MSAAGVIVMFVFMAAFYCIGYLTGYERGLRKYHRERRRY